MIKFLNKKLAEDPDAKIPDNYKVVTDKEIVFEYKLPEHLPLPPAYKDSMMLLDDLMFETTGVHIIEPSSKVVKVKRVVPLPKFNMKNLKGKATLIEERLKESEEKKKKIKEEVLANEKRLMEPVLRQPYKLNILSRNTDFLLSKEEIAERRE